MIERVLLSIVLGLVIPASLEGDEPVRWPQFRGPNGCGVSAEARRLPVHFGPGQNVVWQTALPPGHSSPCVWGNHIFVTGFDEQENRVQTMALDRHSGSILWRRAAPAEKIEQVHPISTPENATPATDGVGVYVYFGSFGLLCLDIDGNVLWQKKLAFPQTDFGTGTSPSPAMPVTK